MGTTPAANTQTSYADFFQAVLAGLGIQNGSQGDYLGLASIVKEEGTNSYNNPFNIEWHAGDNAGYKGVGNFNSVGVQEYATPAQGEAATIAFLKSNPGWQPLINALKGNTGTSDEPIKNALVGEYTWGNHFAGGANASIQFEESTLTSPLGKFKSDIIDDTNGPLSGIGGAIQDTAAAVTSPFDIAKDLYGDVTSVDWWIRVGFIILGLFVVLIAIDKMTDGGITGSSGGSAPQTIDVVTSGVGNAAQSAGTSVKSGAQSAKRSIGKRTYQPKHTPVKNAAHKAGHDVKEAAAKAPEAAE